MDIQVGDRVTYKINQTGTTKTIIIEDTDTIKVLNDLDYKILKIERPKYEVIEEKKELLTEKEKEFLKFLLNYSPYKEEIKFIRKIYDDYLEFIETDNSCSFDFRFKDNYFKNLKDNNLYTLEELGL